MGKAKLLNGSQETRLGVATSALSEATKTYASGDNEPRIPVALARGVSKDRNNNGELAPKFYLWGLAVGEFIRSQVSFWF